MDASIVVMLVKMVQMTCENRRGSRRALSLRIPWDWNKGEVMKSKEPARDCKGRKSRTTMPFVS